MIVASELGDDDQSYIALKLMSVFDHHFDTSLMSMFKQNPASGLLQYWARCRPRLPLRPHPINEWILEKCSSLKDILSDNNSMRLILEESSSLKGILFVL